MRLGLGIGIGMFRGFGTGGPFEPITHIADNQWSANEAEPDADTRRTHAVLTIPFQVGYVIRVYRGTNPLGVLSTGQTAAMSFVGGVYDWTSVGRADLGTTVYVRIARSLPDGSGLVWISDTKQFRASDVPDVPQFTFVPTSSGASLLTFSAPDWSRRVGTGGEYQINGGAFVAFTGTSTLNVTGLSGTTDNVGVRWVNANGYSGVTTQNVASGASPVLSAHSSVTGRTVSIIVENLTGTPTPTGGLATLTLDGVSVIGSATLDSSGTFPVWSYVVPSSSAVQIVNWSLSYTNTAGTGATSGSETIAADLAAPGTVPAQTAYFGALTLSGQGGFRPLNVDGEEVALTGIVSGGGTTPAAQIIGGRLSFSGTGAPNGAAITCSHAGGNVVITITSTANAKSVATVGDLTGALNTQGSSGTVPLEILLRPGAYDVNNNGGNTSGIFHNRRFTSGTRTTVKRHTGQAQRPIFTKQKGTGWNSRVYSTWWLTIEGVDFDAQNVPGQFLDSGKTTGGDESNTHDLTLRDVRLIGPAIPDSALYDTTPWLTGYAGGLPEGFKFDKGFNYTLDGMTMYNIAKGGDYSADGYLTLKNITIFNSYSDALRIIPRLANGGEQVPNAPKVFDNIRVHGFFGINNEQDPGDGSNLAPHNDVMQVIGGTLKYAVFRNIVAARGPYRGNVMQIHQQNARINRCIYHEVVGINKGSNWGFNSEGANYVYINQCTYAGDRDFDVTQIRFGSTGLPAYGEMTIRNTYLGFPSTGTPISILVNNSEDPASVNLVNSFTTISTPQLSLVSGPLSPATATAALLAFKPITDGNLDTNGIGALTTAGEIRGTVIPPMCGVAPGLSVSGGTDLVITPAASLYYDVLPTRWRYRFRMGDGAAWTTSAIQTGANATYANQAWNGAQVMCQWLTAADVPGVWSDASVVSGGMDPGAISAPTVTFVAAKMVIDTLNSSQRSTQLWTSGTQDTTKEHLLALLFRQTSSTSKTMATPPVVMFDQSDVTDRTPTSLAEYSIPSGGLRRYMTLVTTTPLSTDKGIRAMFTATGSHQACSGAAGIKINDAHGTIQTWINSGSSNMAVVDATLTQTISAPTGSRIVAIVFSTQAGGPTFNNLTQIGSDTDDTSTNVGVYVAQSDASVTGSFTVNVSNANAMIIVAIPAP